MDPRETPWNGRVAHVSLRGKVEAERFVEGEEHPVQSTVCDLLDKPGGSRERQLLRGESFIGLDVQDGYVFGFAARDRYCGWVESAAFPGAPSEPATHRISVAHSYGKSTSGLKTKGRIINLSMGTRLALLDTEGDWSRAAWNRGAVPSDLFVPSQHLVPLQSTEPDPVAVAERLLGTPYLWGGNSAFGIDCSGLVQIACLACGIPCPGDSDQQAARLGVPLPVGTPPQRGDLLFWKGHVAWVVDDTRILHANARTMSVAYEDREAAIARIQAAGDGPVTAHKRLT